MEWPSLNAVDRPVVVTAAEATSEDDGAPDAGLRGTGVRVLRIIADAVDAFGQTVVDDDFPGPLSIRPLPERHQGARKPTDERNQP